MHVSSISATESNLRRNLFIKYANSFMGNPQVDNPVEEAEKANPETKVNKIKGIETLTIFPKEIIDGKMVITA